MGMLKITTFGSFPTKSFSTSAEEGGHVMAIKRGIEFLADQLGPAVVLDANLTADKVVPSVSPLGKDKSEV